MGETGLLATTEGAGRRVLLRVDMDALPILEETGAPYASRVPGGCTPAATTATSRWARSPRACWPAARCPAARRVLFQPAEEGEGGAQAALRDGALEGVDVVLGVHLWNELPVGTLGVKAGPLMAAVDRLRIVVRGRGGHGGTPHRSADPVRGGGPRGQRPADVVSREVSPLASAVLTIGSIHGGEAFNVIPDEVTLTGNAAQLRRGAARAPCPSASGASPAGVASALQCQAEVEVRPGNPAVVNDPRVAEIARRAAVRVVGEAKVVEPEPTMGGEDMAVYFERVPGCFVFVGSGERRRAAWTSRTTARASTSTRTRWRSAASSWCRPPWRR